MESGDQVNIIGEETAISSKVLRDKVKGGLYGAYIADSIGSDVEFSKKLTEEQVDEAMKMGFSKIWGTAPGQITDDSEISLALGLALKSKTLDLNEIANWYGKWFGSDPFDIGNTMGNAMAGAYQMKDESNKAKAMMNAASKMKNSKSNGCLMKVLPLCIWCRKLSEVELWKAITSECKLTHANLFNHYINYSYAYLIKYILNSEEPQVSFDTRKKIYEDLKAHLNKLLLEKNVDKDLSNEIMDCFEIAESKNLTGKFDGYGMGFVKIAFSLSLHYFFMEEELDYKSVIAKTISFAGDTDTNAAIVGGLIGCCIGRSQLPGEYVKKLKNFDPVQKIGIPRPKEYVPKHSLKTVLKNVIENAPTIIDINPNF